MHIITEANPGVNTTIMNTGGGWVSVCEPTSSIWRDRRLAIRGRGDESLCAMQMRESGEGFVLISPQWCIRGDGYWYLRNGSNLGVSHPAGYGKYATIEECLAAARKWHAEDPDRREVAAYTSDIPSYLLETET